MFSSANSKWSSRQSLNPSMDICSQQRLRDAQIRLRRMAADDQEKQHKIQELQTELKALNHAVDKLQNLVTDKTKVDEIMHECEDLRTGKKEEDQEKDTKVQIVRQLPPQQTVPRSRTCVVM